MPIIKNTLIVAMDCYFLSIHTFCIKLFTKPKSKDVWSAGHILRQNICDDATLSDCLIPIYCFNSLDC